MFPLSYFSGQLDRAASKTNTGLISMMFSACITLAERFAFPAAGKLPDEAAYGW
jgi:hypothetical protein